jgi:uncharacterized membrane protein YeaQ/YmgE (transglycosylase-associated protein family)
MFAQIVLDPGGIIAWLLVGLISGWLAGMVMKGGGFGIVGDIVVGLIGAFVGGFLFGLLGVAGMYQFWGSVLVAFVGACLMIAFLRLLTPGRASV